MLYELKEFRDLIDQREPHRSKRGVPEPPTGEDITRCIQIMLARQCLYPHMHGVRASYTLLATPEYQGFFRKYFAAMGLEFVHDPRSGMVALRLLPNARRYDWPSARLRKDETLVLFVLRLAYEEAFKANAMGERGTVEITTDDVLEKVEVVANGVLEEARLTEILTLLRRKGVVEMGERDPVERVRPLTILPGIEIAVPEPYIEQVRAWAEGLAASPAPSDGGEDESGADEDPAGGEEDA